MTIIDNASVYMIIGTVIGFILGFIFAQPKIRRLKREINNLELQE